MSAPSEQVFLHVGARKSGTTSLQQALIRSEKGLADQGVHVVYPDRQVARHALMAPLRVLRAGGDRAVAEEAARELRAQIEGRPAAVHLLSVETLAEMPRRVADVVVEALSGYEVHVVVTARHWGLTVPSEWQQGIKSRWTISYADFVTAIRERRSVGKGFLARQDLPGIVDRWGALLPADRVHVVACPPQGRTHDTLVDLYCGVVGIDPAALDLDVKSYNSSLSLGQAELVRRVNVALGDRLPLVDDRYQAGIRRWVVRQTLGRHERSPIRLPDGDGPWVAQEARRQLDALRERGVDLVGDPEDLLADPDAPTGPVEPTSEELVAIAAETIADLASRRLEEVGRLERRIAAERNRGRSRRKARREQ